MLRKETFSQERILGNSNRSYRVRIEVLERIHSELPCGLTILCLPYDFSGSSCDVSLVDSRLARLATENLRNAEVIDSSRRLISSSTIVTPHEDNIVRTGLHCNLLSLERIPYLDKIQFRATIQCDEVSRQRSSINTGRQCSTGCQLNRIRNKRYTDVVIAALTLCLPVILEYIGSIRKDERLHSIYGSSTIRICIGCTAIIGDVECFRASLTIVSSGTVYPCVRQRTVLQEPLGSSLEVIHERSAYLNRQRLGHEYNRDSFAMAIGTLRAQVELVLCTGFQTVNQHRISGNTGEDSRLSALRYDSVRQRVAIFLSRGECELHAGSRRFQDFHLYRLVAVRYRVNNNVVHIEAMDVIVINQITCQHLDSDVLTRTRVVVELHLKRSIRRSSRIDSINNYIRSNISRISHDTYCESSVIRGTYRVSTCTEFHTQCVNTLHFRQNRILILRVIGIAISIGIETQRVSTRSGIRTTIIYLRISAVR